MSLRAKIKKRIFQYIHEIVESSPNPDLAKAILYSAHFTNLRQDIGAKQLKIKENEFGKTVDYLLTKDIISIKNSFNRNLKLIRLGDSKELIDYLLLSDLPFGPRHCFRKKRVDKNTMKEAMQSIEDMVRFKYERVFHFVEGLDHLRKLRNKSHDALYQIRKLEEEYLHKKLQIPEQYTGFPSFVSEEDPTSLAELHNECSFTLNAQFKSIEEAFHVGFEVASGYPISGWGISRIFDETDKKNDYYSAIQRYDINLPKAIHILYEGEYYDINLENICYAANSNMSLDNSPLVYRQAARIMMPILEEKLKKALI